MSPPLNPAQRAAVEHQMGPLLVLAGAGSGKTRVITHRIARLIERGVPARAIVALTFTNKAAAEMRERVVQVLREQGNYAAGKGLTISTFHSFGLGVLTKERNATGGPFTIFDQGDCLGVIKDLLGRIDAGRKFDAQNVLARISQAKNAFLSEADLPDDDADPYAEITKILYPRYQSALRNFRAYDFDDLVCGVADLWRQRQDVRARWQAHFRFVLVDEYQDTNGAQLALLRTLSEPHKNVCVVGDDDQSIYAWRGADVRNILDFETHFPGATVVKLEQNYRSRAPILEVANAVIHKRTDARHQKTLFTERAGGDKVKVAVAATPDIEAAYVARELKRAIREEQRRPRDMAVLYRSNGQAKALEEALREQAVPHRVVGGQQFFERKEVKDVLSYMKLALHPADEISLRRIINYPPRGIGEASLERLTLHALAKGWTLLQAVERVDALDDIPSAARDGCKALERIVEATRQRLLKDNAQASAVVREVCDSVGLRAELDATSGSVQAATRRWGNVEALFATFGRREAKRAAASDGDDAEDASSVDGLARFLNALTLQFSEEGDAPQDVVTLSTLHGSKGLEFDVVYLVGCEEGLLPHARTVDARTNEVVPQDIEEERRLFYVGVTRAKERLTLSRAKTRAQRGKAVARTPSRFLADVPEHASEPVEIKDEPGSTRADMEQGASALLAALDALGGLDAAKR
jgi:superfamily I DNA/RNA helicase